MTETTPPPHDWHVFPNAAPPDQVIAGFRMLLTLPKGAQQNLWRLISLSLEHPNDPENAKLIDQYSAHFETSPPLVLGAVWACDFVLRQAAALNLDKESFVSDLQRLSGTDRAVVDLLSSPYLEVRDKLRGQLLEDALADHGAVLVGFDWRVDRITASNRGSMDDVTIVHLNLKYRTGDEKRQLSLQLTPDAIATLKAFWNQFRET